MQTIKAKTESTAVSAAPAKKNIQQLIKSMEPAIKKALPSVITPERYTRIVLSAISRNPQLAQCTPESFLGAMMTSAQLGLEVNTPLGQCYLIPYRNHNTLECQFQLGYKGMIDLAWRGGQITDIAAHTVYENDEFSYELGLNPDLKHKPAASDRGKPVYYYAVYHTKNGGFGFEVMSMADIIEHRDQFSKAAGKGFSPWATNFDEMAKKTVLKKALKYAPMGTEFVRAVSCDGSIKTEIDEDMYTVPDNTITTGFVDGEETLSDSNATEGK